MSIKHILFLAEKRLIFDLSSKLTWSYLEEKFKGVLNDEGRFSPDRCTPIQKIAFIIPFRDREEHLKIFLNHMHSILPSQEIEGQVAVQIPQFRQPFSSWSNRMSAWMSWKISSSCSRSTGASPTTGSPICS